MKKINIIFRKCKSLSKQLSSKSIGSKSARHHPDNTSSSSGIIWNTNAISSVYNRNDDVNSEGDGDSEQQELVFVGSTRKRYVISSKYMSHPLINALIEKSKRVGDNDNDNDNGNGNGNDNEDVSVINCEVVLFDHLLWMLENKEFNAGSDCLDELADLYSV
ncbi:putative small auxin-up RNA [Helianthus annuus]|nr:putative small auxin-up RNA [Helianthus annuus]